MLVSGHHGVIVTVLTSRPAEGIGGEVEGALMHLIGQVEAVEHLTDDRLHDVCLGLVEPRVRKARRTPVLPPDALPEGQLEEEPHRRLIHRRAPLSAR